MTSDTLKHCGCLAPSGNLCPNGHPGRKTLHFSGQHDDVAAVHEALTRLGTGSMPPHIPEAHVTGDERCPRCKALRERHDDQVRVIALALTHYLERLETV